MDSAHNWWFSLVGAAPNPESPEQVNVALLIGNGRLLRLEYDRNLSRASCIAGPSDRALLRDLLDSIARDLRDFSQLDALRQYVGAKVRISNPRPLLYEPDRKTLSLLRKKYLGSEKRRRSRRRSVERVARIDETLREHLPSIAFGVTVEKRVSPEDLFPEVHRRVFSDPVPNVDRAIRAAHRDLLIGGVAIDPRRPIQSIQNPSVRLGRAFWHYHDSKQRLLELTGHEVRTVGLIYSGSPESSGYDAAREAGEYVAHVWSQDADIVLHPDDPREVARLRDEFAWVVE